MIEEMKQNVNNIHFIAIGGSVMHALALALDKSGHHITGSDDQFFSPSKEALSAAGILPKSIGFDENNIHDNIDLVILGMHAKEDNPELLKAQKLNLPIQSFPEFLADYARQKQRIVVSGSHGKSTVVSMLIHVLDFHDKKYDYVSGASLPSNAPSVRLNDAPCIIIEGDEYLSSKVDPRPKFMHYDPHNTIITGIAWDHINVFPTEKDYIDTFGTFINKTSKGASVVYNETDKMLKKLIEKSAIDATFLPYKPLKSKIKQDTTFLVTDDGEVPIQVFGEHNMLNLSAAKTMLSILGITPNLFYEAIQSYQGAKKRLTLISEHQGNKTFQDFAHAPSKVRASVRAVVNQYKKKHLSTFLELHTFSSLNKDFIQQYRESLDGVDEPFIYMDPQAVDRKGSGAIDEQYLKKAFNKPSLTLVQDTKTLKEKIEVAQNKGHTLLMTSANFGGIINDFIQ